MNLKRVVIILLIGAMLLLGTGFTSGARWTAQHRDGSGEVHKRVNPYGTCELVDAQGVPLYDSQFAERTGSDPCAQEADLPL